MKTSAPKERLALSELNTERTGQMDKAICRGPQNKKKQEGCGECCEQVDYSLTVMVVRENFVRETTNDRTHSYIYSPNL